jgi:beta-glucanase (GH16 family)
MNIKNNLHKFFTVVTLGSICLTTSSYAQGDPKTLYQQDGYKLVWADEFNETGKPNVNSWRYEEGFVRNQELQWYQAANAWCQDGMLIIEARKEIRSNPRYNKDSKDWKSTRENITHTASSINTRGMHSWQYGRFVMRGKIDVSAGLWPAWWTLGVAGEWPSNGEIDIMEYYAGKMLANIAIGTNKRYNAEWFSVTKTIPAFGGEKWAAQFHIWRMDWTEKSIDLFVDDELLMSVPMDSLYNKDGSNTHPFKQPHYMLLNLAMGGMNGGELRDTKFPNRFVVDYVRVYQR